MSPSHSQLIRVKITVGVLIGASVGAVAGILLSSWDHMVAEKLIEGMAAALTPMIAIIAAVIGYGHLQNERNRTRLDLFDRRMKVFEAVRGNVFSVITDVGIEPHRACAGSSSSRTARFDD